MNDIAVNHSGNDDSEVAARSFETNLKDLLAAAKTPVKRQRIRWLEAFRGIRKLSADPDDTDTVFVILSALSGNSQEKHFQRFVTKAVGQKILSQKRDLLDCLKDKQYLASLPEGSLGREYLAFMQREKISPDGLISASNSTNSMPALDEHRTRYGARNRDCHDLQHVVTGYGRDIVGEASLLAFGTAQSWSLGFALISFEGYRGFDKQGRDTVWNAAKRGRKADKLNDADWEALLPQSLSKVREMLHLGTQPNYTAMRSDGAPTIPSSA